MSSVRVIPNVDSLRASAHDLAQVLSVSSIGGECYHGGRHTCFTRQGRKPIGLYKHEELCERCALAWHATMAASLLDQLVIGQRFLGNEAELPSMASPATPSLVTLAPDTLACPKCEKKFQQKNHLSMHVRHCKDTAGKKGQTK